VEPASNEFQPPVRSFSGTPRLSVTAAFPQKVLAGKELATLFVISNTGTADAYDVVLTVEVPSLLEHHEGQLVEHRIRHLPAGAVRRAEFRAIARSAGSGRIDAVLTGRDAESQNWTANFNVGPRTTGATSTDSPGKRDK
jgi:hypothetical protein